MAAVVAAVGLRFVQDDAFITFRYAENWASGLGPVFNPDDRVEGYTNFLWMALMVLPHMIGVDVVTFAHLVGIIAMVVTLLATYHVGRMLFDDSRVGLAAASLCTINYSFLSYATGGLETSLVTALVMLAMILLLPILQRGGAEQHSARLVAASVVMGLALLARLDSLLLIVVPCVIALWHLVRCHHWRSVGLLSLPGATIVAWWMAWKLSFYGGVLPNTFYVKASGVYLPVRGAYYIIAFMLSYFLWIPLVLYVLRLRDAIRVMGRLPALALHATLVLWALYLVKIGGDFMEFRMIVPAMPLLMILLAWGLMQDHVRAVWRWAVAGLLLIASVVHGATFDRSPLCRGMESIPGLAGHLTDSATGWIAVGKSLNSTIDSPKTVRVALTPAGAIPYYSQVHTIDMLGLNDPQVLRHGEPLTGRAGHSRIASLDYLVGDAGAHLILCHPLPASAEARARGYYRVVDLKHMFWRALLEPERASIPHQASVLEMPIEGAGTVVALYIHPHPRIDALIDSGRWRAYPLRR